MPSQDQAVPYHVDEPDQLVGGPGRDPAQAVRMDEAFPVPLRGIEHAGLERLGVQQVGLLIGERAAPSCLDRHRQTLGLG